MLKTIVCEQEGTGNREQGTGKTSQSSQITKTPVLKMDAV